MKINTLLEKIFSDELAQHGFIRVPGQWLSYICQSPDRRQHLDFQLYKQTSSFSVDLQDIGKTERRAILLEEFEGLKNYAFEPSSLQSMQSAAQQAYEHFKKYGVRWFNGEDIVTDARNTACVAGDGYRFEQFVREGREAFNRGDFENALIAFSNAEAIKTLDRVSVKYRELATKKLGLISQ